MAECVFCSIVAGDIPCAKVYEDAQVLAFLDIHPVTPGHVLLIPKEHFPLLTDIPEETMAALGRAMPRLARALVRATGAQGFNVFQSNGHCAGQEIMHAHFHLIGRRAGDGIGIRPAPGAYRKGELERCRDAILSALGEEPSPGEGGTR